MVNLERLSCRLWTNIKICRGFKVFKVIDFQLIFLAGFISYSKRSIRYISETSEQMLITRYKNQIIPLFEPKWILKKDAVRVLSVFFLDRDKDQCEAVVNMKINIQNLLLRWTC